MAIIFHQFNSAQELVDYLNDIMLSGQLPSSVAGLNGLTLILNATTVTFVDAAGAGLSPNAIVTQINTAVAGAASLRNYGHMQSPPTCQLAMVKASMVVHKEGTANPLFGFSATADTTVGAHAVAKTDIIAITSDAMASRYSVFHA